MTNKANLTELNQPERKQKTHLKAETKVSLRKHKSLSLFPLLAHVLSRASPGVVHRADNDPASPTNPLVSLRVIDRYYNQSATTCESESKRGNRKKQTPKENNINVPKDVTMHITWI